MKIKKWWTRVGSFCVGASLLSTILTSCSASKIDKDLIVELDNNGNLIGENIKDITLDYKEAIRLALTRADSWTSFKEALAEEIVCMWFENRAGENRNQDLQDTLDAIEKETNDTYDKNLQSCKDKYGSNYNFYFQNQYLSPNGGTAKTYKHALKVRAIKTKFISNVWNSNYFGYCKGWETKQKGVYPRMLEDEAKPFVSESKLNDPASWNDLGFFAYAKVGYNPRVKQPAKKEDLTDDDIKKLAKYGLDGDYATIQNFVFNKWFETEKPFFSAASLFKYSKPAQTDNLSLKDIYNASLGVTLSDEPNEAFPFFGGSKPEDKSAGTRAYYRWYHDLVDGVYLKAYDDALGAHHSSNGTVSIPKDGHTDDSQTLLLSYATKMMGGSDGALYVPYATAAAQLYAEALGIIKTDTKNTKMNEIDKSRIERNLGGRELDYIDENLSPILKNFFFTEDDGAYAQDETPQKKWYWKPATESGITSLNSFVDLSKIYESTRDQGGTGNFHCRLFVSPKDDESFDFFYGKVSDRAAISKPGIRYIANTVKVNLTALPASVNESQPWILELNESGMHAQTIDGYKVIKNPTDYGQKNQETAAKNLLKYRLMQKKAQIGDHESISADVFGASGALAKYFEDNFANIILEMALEEKSDENVFRPIENYSKEWPETNDKKDYLYFIDEIIDNEQFVSTIKAYLKATREYDEKKKIVDALAAANKQVYSYHSEQVKNSKYEPGYRQIYNNGLTAPLAYSHESHDMGVVDPEWSMHDFSCINPVVYFNWNTDGKAETSDVKNYTNYALKDLMVGTGGKGGIINDPFVVFATTNVEPEQTSHPFSPQIKAAKAVNSNRFWYHSALVDSAIYKSMGSTGLVNNIKYQTLNTYIADKVFEDKTITDFDAMLAHPSFANPITSTYYKSKVITGGMTYADVASKPDFFEAINNFYKQEKEIQKGLEGGVDTDYSTFNTNWETFRATLCYLMYDANEDGTQFDNFYRILNSKISEDEPAFIGYLNKFNTQLDDKEKYKHAVRSIPTSSEDDFRYKWTSNVDNIFDQIGYISDVNQHDLPDTFKNAKVACDQYWNVMNKTFPIFGSTARNIQLAGFTGLQTRTTNALPTKLQNAVFPSSTDYSAGLAGHTNGSIDLFRSPDSSTTTRYEENAGAWFSFAGNKEINGQLIEFEVSWEDDKNIVHTIDQTQFPQDYGEDHLDLSVCRRLAKKMCNYSTLDDLRALAKELGDSHYGSTIYREIADGEGDWKHMNINQLRYEMVKALPRIDPDGGGRLVNDEFLPCFSRLTNVEVHSTGADSEGATNISYYFDDDSAGGYNLMLTQISKADITEKTLHPTWEGTGASAHWAQGTSPITPDEFFFMLCQTACESSTQSLAIAEAVKDIFGTNKIKVMDACLYNAFDSVWIKDWVKKPMGE